MHTNKVNPKTKLAAIMRDQDANPPEVPEHVCCCGKTLLLRQVILQGLR